MFEKNPIGLLRPPALPSAITPEYAHPSGRPQDCRGRQQSTKPHFTKPAIAKFESRPGGQGLRERSPAFLRRGVMAIHFKEAKLAVALAATSAK